MNVGPPLGNVMSLSTATAHPNHVKKTSLSMMGTRVERISGSVWMESVEVGSYNVWTCLEKVFSNISIFHRCTFLGTEKK